MCLLFLKDFFFGSFLINNSKKMFEILNDSSSYFDEKKITVERPSGYFTIHNIRNLFHFIKFFCRQGQEIHQL